MNYTLIGVRTLIQNQESYSFGSADMTQYTVFLKGEDKLTYKMEFTNSFGDCGSGYTSATWADMQGPDLYGGSIGTLHYVPKDYALYYTVVKNHLLEGGYGYLEGLLAVGMTDTFALSSSGDGGDNYYPCGSSDLNLELFTATPRLVAKRKVFVLTGPSCIGKSFLASHTDLKVYETDRSSNLPADLDAYDIIVVGNKHPLTQTEIVTALAGSSIDAVAVAFSPLAVG